MITPLDLQTLYMNLDKVSKEQAHSKEAMAQAQANQVQKMQKEHDQGQHSVARTSAAAAPEGDAMKVQEDGQNAGQGRRGNAPETAKSEAEEKEKNDTAWKDPELGKHVDLSG